MNDKHLGEICCSTPGEQHVYSKRKATEEMIANGINPVALK